MNADHQHAVNVLKSAGSDITMVVAKADALVSPQVSLSHLPGLYILNSDLNREKTMKLLFVLCDTEMSG